MSWVVYQTRAMIAEKLLGWAMALDPTPDREVRRCYRDLWRAKVVAMARENGLL